MRPSDVEGKAAANKAGLTYATMSHAVDERKVSAHVSHDGKVSFRKAMFGTGHVSTSLFINGWSILAEYIS
jgi:hypothetical protein